jgi:sugar lactone lactonase YvrE
MTSYSVDIAFAIPSELGEGALWDERQQRLYWVDITQNKVYAFNPGNKSNLAYDVGESVGSVVLTEDDLILLGLRSGIGCLDPSTGSVFILAHPEPGKPHTRLNDGKCDPLGRFWVGSICEKEPMFDGGLYCLNPDLSVEKKLSNTQCSNGLVWTSDTQTFYYIDTPTQEIWGFCYDVATASLSEKRVAARIPHEMGHPDGMTIDTENHLWVALWNGSRVVRIDPSNGRIELEIPVPARNVTSVAFGGRDLDELFITTAQTGKSNEERQEHPLAGSLFHTKLPYHGLPAKRFSGHIPDTLREFELLRKRL